MSETGQFLYVGGFPTNREAHAATSSILTFLEGRGEQPDLIPLQLDDDNDDDDGGKDKKPEKKSDIRELNELLQATDLSPYLERIEEHVTGEEVVGYGLCLGATLLAAYQDAAHRNPDLSGLEQLVLLDPIPAVATDYQTVSIRGYNGDDAVAIYDDAVPAEHTVNGIPHLRTDGGGHLWQEEVDDLGEAAYEIARRTAAAERQEQYAILTDVAEAYDGLAVPVEQEAAYVEATSSRLEHLSDILSPSIPRRQYHASPGSD
ncbi:MAG: hypothetical protein SVW77_04080 [Candidatus Nanohaloarchaea archaeon]|nr:hypothetical protein [Candidatus Nanohaloarchaea archaeon]